MRLTETKHIRIEGTEVTAVVNTAKEAKLAVKELRHKKREYAHLKRGLIKARKKAESRATKPKRKSRGNPTAIDHMRGFFGNLMGVSGALKRANAEEDLKLIEREITKTDEILHNIDGVLLQVEGKLLHHS